MLSFKSVNKQVSKISLAGKSGLPPWALPPAHPYARPRSLDKKYLAFNYVFQESTKIQGYNIFNSAAIL